MFDKTITLSNGIEIPQLALGTWLIDDDEVANVIKNAVDVGYRHFDTAQAYANERGVGEGVRNASIPREEIFVTSKVMAENKTYDSAYKSIDETLDKMELDYIDMMVIHSPQPWKDVNQSDNRYFEENREVWKAMIDAYNEGKIKAIGVSNFLKEDIDNLYDWAEVKPMVNQVLCHISNTPLDLIEYCQNKNIQMEAYAPVAHGEPLKDEKIVEMTKKYDVTIQQLCIRYDLQLGMITLPKTTNVEHMKSNMDVDFIISDEDMDILKNVEKIKGYGESGHFPVFGGKI